MIYCQHNVIMIKFGVNTLIVIEVEFMIKVDIIVINALMKLRDKDWFIIVVSIHLEAIILIIFTKEHIELLPFHLHHP